MKVLYFYISITLFLLACNSAQQEQELPVDNQIQENQSQEEQIHKLEGIPEDGIYRYDIAFAEYGGKSMGEKVTVTIKGNSVEIIYEGDGSLTAKKGEFFDGGTVMKHKSGQWIISDNPDDASLDEVGGCTDGPSIIDFEKQQYWMC